MEQLLERPSPEQLRHFNVAASINRLRFDVLSRGYVQNETLERVCDEELSYVAEGLDRPSQTVFALREIGGQFMYFSEGSWCPYSAMLTNGISAAQSEANRDPRKSFLVDMALDDYLIAQQWQQLALGEKMNWYSEFHDRELGLYGEEFMNSLGFQSRRRMGFLYEAKRDYEGNLILTTTSVDNSDKDAFEAAMLAAGDGQDALAAYDATLNAKHGLEYRAGRLKGHEENAWDIIQRHKDLITFYLENLQDLARNTDVVGHDLERQKKRLTYGFWAAIKERTDSGKRGILNGESTRPHVSLSQEVTQAYLKLQAKGEVLFGCGGSIKGEEALLSAETSDVFDAIFGDNEESSNLPAQIRCINCKQKVLSRQVVKAKSWCCPKCKYEVDICNGRVINHGAKKAA